MLKRTTIPGLNKLSVCFAKNKHRKNAIMFNEKPLNIIALINPRNEALIMYAT